MPLIPFTTADGLPNAAALFVNAVLTAALYHEDEIPWKTYATSIGGNFKDFLANKNTVEPDFGVILCNGEALVCFGGTTNSAQWCNHICSAIIPNIDFQVPLTTGGSPFVVDSFHYGLSIVESRIDAAINSIGTGKIRIGGHSYGAGCGFIYGRHLASSTLPPIRTELMTCGEPRTYDGRIPVKDVDVHFRMIAANDPVGAPGADPVPLTPTGGLQLFSFLKYVKFLKPLLSFSWTYWGQGWFINNTDIVMGPGLPIFVDAILPLYAVTLGDQLQYADLHLSDTSYLPKAQAAWKRSGLNPELAPLVRFSELYQGKPFTPVNVVGPAWPARHLNEKFMDPSNTPVTDPGRSEWETISAAGQFSPIQVRSNSMTLMRGSFLNQIIGQGFSETWHSANPSDNYASMKTKLANISQQRANCSDTLPGTPSVGIANALTMPFQRISDDLLQRDVLAYPTGTHTEANWNTTNLDGQLATKLVWRNASNQQIAVTYMHGVPLEGVIGTPTRNCAFTGLYQNVLTQYCNAVAGQGLGFNTLNLAPANAMGPIVSCVYNAVTGNYLFTMTNAVPQGAFRVRIAKMKILRYLNGRWPAQSTGANTFILSRPMQNFTWDNTGTAVPLSGYNNNVPFSNYQVVLPSTVTPLLVVSKKLGKPFFLQHGRVSRRAAA